MKPIRSFVEPWAEPLGVWSAVCVCLLAFSATSAAHEGHAALPTKGAKVAGDQLLLSDGARKAIGMTMAEVSLGDIHHTVTANARVEVPWQQHALVTTLIPGRISRLLVRPGDRVEAGQELAWIESLELETLQMEMLQAAEELALANRLVDQRADLASGGVIAGKESLEAVTIRDQKAARLELVKRKLQALGLSRRVLDRVQTTGEVVPGLSILSPIRGHVAHSDVQVGEVVEPTQHLFDIVDPAKVGVIGQVLESDVSRVRAGQTVDITFRSLSGVAVSGEITHIHMTVDPLTRTQEVMVSIDNTSGVLRPGLFGRMHIQVAVAKDAILCPRHALIETPANSYVLLERGEGRYVRRTVKTGGRTKAVVEILDGLFPGDRVVVVGNRVLASLFGPDESSPKLDAARLGKNQSTQGAVAVRDVGTAPPDRTVVAHGTVELPTGANLFATSRVEGRLSRILVEHGQYVESGQILAEVDGLELRSLQLDLLQAKAELTWTEKSIDRLVPLAWKRITAQRELWQLRSRQQNLQHSVASMSRRLRLMGFLPEEIVALGDGGLIARESDEATTLALPIRAPANGWIADFNVVPGQVVRPEEHLFEIHDLSKVWVKAFLYEPEAGLVEHGHQAKITFTALAGATIEGTVVRVAPVATGMEHVVPSWIEVDNPQQRLKEGMLARVAIQTRPRPKRLTTEHIVPVSELQPQGSER